MAANDRQEGGAHYVSEYQHWDWVTDIGLGYLLSAATKYVTRHRSKNGVEDLKKALHYFEKYCEVIKGRHGMPMEVRPLEWFIRERTEEFTHQNHVPSIEANIIMNIATFVVRPPETWNDLESEIKADLNHLISAGVPVLN